MNDELIEIPYTFTPGIIKVIGVGGGGGNAVGQMYRDHIPEVRYLVANTDRKALADSPVPDHLQLGPGLGAGGDPQKGREYAEESVEKIKKELDKDTKMVFITAGMGGGTGTGASPVIAREARQKGILTVGIVTLPFLFERERQIDKALDGLEVLAGAVDAVLVINNQRLCDIYPNLSIIDAFRHADQTLSTAVSSITEIISMHGKINLDFEDVKFVLTDGGVAVMSTGYGEGENRVTRAIEGALNSPLLNNNDVYNADRILIALTTSDNAENALLTREFAEVQEFMDRFSPDIHTKWGLAVDPGLGKKIKITILASGFGLYRKKEKPGKPINETTELPEPESEESIVNNHRRNRYYGVAVKTKRRPRFYIFGEDDLWNENVISRVENVPTQLRSYEHYEAIKQASESEE